MQSNFQTINGRNKRAMQYVGCERARKKINATIIDMTKTTMYGIPVELAIPVTTLTIESVGQKVFHD